METNNEPPPLQSPLPARKKYVHLYMPLLTSLFILSNATTQAEDDPLSFFLLSALSAIPTYLVASTIYPSNPPSPSPHQAIRFTRKHDAYRALVLFMYGRLYGTPFNLRFLIADFMCSYAIGYAIGERPVGTRQRRSEFLMALVWLAASWVIMAISPLEIPLVFNVVVAVDRTIWRAAWLALVDDVVGTLVWPDVRRLRGRVTLVLAQSVTITGLVFFVVAWVRRIEEWWEMEGVYKYGDL